MGCVEIMVTDRQKHVLKLLVDDYIRMASPIASEALVRNHDLGVSSATIRNDVAELEDLGYLTRPYASAGSVPLDMAYRLYVESYVPEDSLLPTNSGHPLAGLSHRQRRELRQEKISQILAAIARRLDSDSSKSGEF